MFLITKNSRPIAIYNSQEDAEFYRKTRHQKHLYTIENTLKEITEDHYDFLLEVLPPIYHNGFMFANSEPVDHLAIQGRAIPIFNGCTQKGGKYYQFICTVESIKNLLPSDIEV
ncbi:uncharacterized protein DUF1419 [Arcicella aurantiaca]|uniref:Uncharacterized protein DUF1419 n=1 Tax=Arcicella aurantiaca TaxID=591202 RepID=A0A316EVF7_9BACT|nr:DUF1419 domain-containing protein [Arcicella aurantiaca]PWK27176.1 uncharacterized protein DUF1419 [Arcicella aurantiaca]